MKVAVKIDGLDKLEKNLAKFPKEISKNIGQAGSESAERIIFPTTGLKSYPPATSPTYIRGRGTQFATYNDNKSERFGTQFYSRNDGTKTFIGNRASYAIWLTDEDKQTSVLAGKGWRKMRDVINEKFEEIKDVYQNWINRIIQELGL
jgi:hypothetical protein